MRKREKSPETPRFLAGIMRDEDAVLRGKAGRAGWWLEWEKGDTATSVLSGFAIPMRLTGNDM